MVTTKDDIVDKLRAPYGRLTRAMREDAACEIERLRADKQGLREVVKDAVAFIREQAGTISALTRAAALKETEE